MFGKKKKDITNLRNAFRIFALAKLDYRIRKGDFDNCLKDFIEGDSLKINYDIDLLPNDIIIFNVLSQGSVGKDILRKVEKMWNKEK